MPEIKLVEIRDLETHPQRRVNVPELARYWGVGKTTVYRLAENGALPCRRIGRRVLIDRDAAIEFERAAGAPKREDDDLPSGQGRR